jgi:hypothetical protein
VPQILRLLARGPFRPRALWSIVEHIVARPSLLAVCGPFVDWCRVAVAMGVGSDNPLHAIDGYPQTVAHTRHWDAHEWQFGIWTFRRQRD